MGGKRRESGLRALRRGAALGLALTALWIFGLTADLSGAWDALGRLGQTPSFVLGALSQELEGASAGDGLSPDLDRWGRLLLAQSALLSGGRPAVDAFLAEQAQADSGMAELWVSGGRVTAAQGAALYVTNTEAYICITDSAQVQGGSGVAVKAAAGQWGSSGNNGGRLVLRSDGAMEGAIEYDSLSSVETVTAAETEANAKTP